jgi:putative ABC transport system ATP-binding protein
MNKSAAIVAHHITKGYNEAETYHPILSETSVEVAQGCIVALLGKSGSGKSALLNLLSGIDTPEQGRITIGGAEITGKSERERTMVRRQKLGFVFQFFNLLPTLSVEENIFLPLELAGKADKEHKQRAQALLEEVGLGHRLRAMPDRLSGGEQQRVAIVRALAHEPPIILADEPTGNLDADTGATVLELFTRLVRQQSCTLMVATHSPEVVAIADRVIAIRHGKIVDISGGEALHG